MRNGLAGRRPDQFLPASSAICQPNISGEWPTDALQSAPNPAPIMALAVGTRLGPYEILSALGAGRNRDRKDEIEGHSAMLSRGSPRGRFLKGMRPVSPANVSTMIPTREIAGLAGEAECAKSAGTLVMGTGTILEPCTNRCGGGNTRSSP
jgi:hypothetical protein